MYCTPTRPCDILSGTDTKLLLMWLNICISCAMYLTEKINIYFLAILLIKRKSNRCPGSISSIFYQIWKYFTCWHIPMFSIYKTKLGRFLLLHTINVLRPRLFNLIVQHIPKNMPTVFALLCFVWLIFPYPSGLLHWHCGNLTIAPVPAKQPWWIWINTSCEFIMNDCITTTKQTQQNRVHISWDIQYVNSHLGNKAMKEVVDIQSPLPPAPRITKTFEYNGKWWPGIFEVVMKSTQYLKLINTIGPLQFKLPT